MSIRIEVDYEPGKASVQGYNKESEVHVTGPMSKPGVRISYSIQIRWYLPTPEAYIPFRTVKTKASTTMGRMPTAAMTALRNELHSAKPTIPDGPHVRNVKRTRDMLAVHDLPGPSSKIINLADGGVYPIRFAAIFSISCTRSFLIPRAITAAPTFHRSPATLDSWCRDPPSTTTSNWKKLVCAPTSRAALN